MNEGDTEKYPVFAAYKVGYWAGRQEGDPRMADAYAKEKYEPGTEQYKQFIEGFKEGCEDY